MLVKDFYHKVRQNDLPHYSGTYLRGREGKHKKRLKKRALLDECLKRRSSQF
jgi:hypothetical protein